MASGPDPLTSLLRGGTTVAQTAVAVKVGIPVAAGVLLLGLIAMPLMMFMGLSQGGGNANVIAGSECGDATVVNAALTTSQNPQQQEIAAAIYSQAMGLGLGENAALIGIVTGLAESRLTNITKGDTPVSTSRGVYQQIETWAPRGLAWSGIQRNRNIPASEQFHDGNAWTQPGGWALRDPRMNPPLAANLFFRVLKNQKAFKAVKDAAAITNDQILDAAWAVQRFRYDAAGVQNYMSQMEDGRGYLAQIKAGQITVPAFVQDDLTAGSGTSSGVTADTQPAGQVAAAQDRVTEDNGALFLGDSLMVGMTSLGGVPSELYGGPVTIDALEGVSLGTVVHGRIARFQDKSADMRQWRRDIKTGPSRIFVSLGTNPSNDFAEDLETFLGWAGPTRLVYWYTLNESTPRPALNKTMRGYNQALSAATARHPNLRLVNFATQAAVNADYQAGDGIHFSAAGYQAMWSSTGTQAALTVGAVYNLDCAGMLLAGLGGGPSNGDLGARAVQVALKLLADNAQYDSSGGGVPPRTVDCSKMTAYAYRQAGHPYLQALSWGQYSDRAHVVFVPLEQAQPGDLLFFYTGGGQGRSNPISHVTMVLDPVQHTMIGAENSRVDMEINNWDRYPYKIKGLPDANGHPTDGPPVAGRVVFTEAEQAELGLTTGGSPSASPTAAAA